MSRNEVGKIGRDQTVKNCIRHKQLCAYAGRKWGILGGLSREVFRASYLEGSLF